MTIFSFSQQRRARHLADAEADTEEPSRRERGSPHRCRYCQTLERPLKHGRESGARAGGRGREADLRGRAGTVLCVGSAQAGSTRGAAKVCSGTLCDPRPRCASRVTPGARRPRRLLPRVPGRRRERRQRRDIDVDVRPQVPQKMHRMLVRCKHRLPVLPRASDSAGALSPPHQDRAAQHLPERENRVNGRLAAGILATPLALPRQRTTLVR
jgi:hypothetical protein